MTAPQSFWTRGDGIRRTRRAFTYGFVFGFWLGVAFALFTMAIYVAAGGY